MKDLFSIHSKIYATFRPTYPEELYQFVFKHVKNFENAWDCATGNGQVAGYLSKHFKNVFATDISQQQLENAPAAENITYSVQPAEKTNFDNHSFDLITVAQALHWFDREKFYEEVRRVSKPNSLVAVCGYYNCSVSPEIDPIFYRFYEDTVGPHWDSARKLVEEKYSTIEFPFEEIPSPEFAIKVMWTLEHFSGYLSSWSATQKYIKANNHDPVPLVMEEMKPYWKESGLKEVIFPVFMRLGRV